MHPSFRLNSKHAQIRFVIPMFSRGMTGYLKVQYAAKKLNDTNYVLKNIKLFF